MGTFTDLVGKRIVDVLTNADNTVLAFRTSEGRYMAYCTSGDCCNTVWFNHATGLDTVLGEGNVFDLLRGAVVTGAEDKGWDENRNADEHGYEVIQDGFWTLRTDRGYIDFEVRNSHNGYYGGHVEAVDESEIDITELRSVRDF